MCCMGRCVRKCIEGIFGLVISAGIVVLIYWAIFQPRQIRATVASAALSNLTVSITSPSAAVSYALAVNLTLYNPSTRVNIYYDAVDARAPFDGRGVAVDGGVAGEVEKEVKAATVRFEVDVDLRVRYVFRIFKLRQKPRVRCWISVPVKAEGGGGAVGGVIGSGDRCSVKY
ncbi:hypothetical protein PR202_gb00473 [Eleusine coracana subsp. coracana]|uniref:Late embryogenesis abundant protein LEA-2 subgroup domain-containing protein n=1 Tax=Eleusine coracana subsp. coracana TaxID=191504 RepID=A0AAV5DSP0_ELECO|nr:hypothetical protein PR202_gb00473 [Eleusine coracana subsp. coracana]